MPIWKTVTRPAKAPFLLGRYTWPLASVRVARTAHAQWQERLTARQRKQAWALIRASRGRPSNLTPKQRKQLQHLIGTLRPADFARGLALAALVPGKSKKRRLLRR